MNCGAMATRAAVSFHANPCGRAPEVVAPSVMTWCLRVPLDTRFKGGRRAGRQGASGCGPIASTTLARSVARLFPKVLAKRLYGARCSAGGWPQVTVFPLGVFSRVVLVCASKDCTARSKLCRGLALQCAWSTVRLSVVVFFPVAW